MTEAGPLHPRARKDVQKYLLPDERAVVATRRHWAVLLEPTVKFLPVFLIGGWLLVLDPDNKVTSSAGLLVLVGSLVYYGLRVGEWWMRTFIVSTRRVLLTSGVVVRTVTLLPLRRITDLTWKETPLGSCSATAPSGSSRPASSRRCRRSRSSRAPTSSTAGSAGSCSAATGAGRPPAATTRATPSPPSYHHHRRTTVVTPNRSRPSSRRGVTPPRPGQVRRSAVRQAERRCGSTCTPIPRCPTAPRPRPNCWPRPTPPASTSSA